MTSSLMWYLATFMVCRRTLLDPDYFAFSKLKRQFDHGKNGGQHRCTPWPTQLDRAPQLAGEHATATAARAAAAAELARAHAELAAAAERCTALAAERDAAAAAAAAAGAAQQEAAAAAAAAAGRWEAERASLQARRPQALIAGEPFFDTLHCQQSTVPRREQHRGGGRSLGS